MSAEGIFLENLTPGLLAGSANPFCEGCNDLRLLGNEVTDELPATESIDPAVVVARFAGFAALCPRKQPIPAAECKPGGCSTIDESRQCLLKELTTMGSEQRATKVKELASPEPL